MEEAGDSVDRRKVGAIERHIQTGILAIGVGLIGWFAHTVENNNTNQAVLADEAKRTSKDIDELKTTLRDEMYRRSDAKRDVDATNGQIAELRGQVSELRGRVASLELVLNPRIRQIQSQPADWSRK